MGRSAHAANICVAVMLRAANTAVQALMAEISPWMLRNPVSVQAGLLIEAITLDHQYGSLRRGIRLSRWYGLR
jgi:hypothetical protein